MLRLILAVSLLIWSITPAISQTLEDAQACVRDIATSVEHDQIGATMLERIDKAGFIETVAYANNGSGDLVEAATRVEYFLKNPKLGPAFGDINVQTIDFARQSREIRTRINGVLLKAFELVGSYEALYAKVMKYNPKTGKDEKVPMPHHFTMWVVFREGDCRIYEVVWDHIYWSRSINRLELEPASDQG